MDWTEISLADVSDSEIETAADWLVGLLSEKFPSIDFSRGAAYGLVVLPAAFSAAAIKVYADKLWNSHNLALLASGDVDEEAADAFLQNYRITRRAASYATGTVRVLVDSRVPVFVPAGTRFETGDGISFVSTENVNGKLTEEEVVDESDQLLQRSGAWWYVLVPVTAETAGTTGNIAAGTALTTTLSLDNLVGCVAADTFSGGAYAETLQDAVARVTAGVSAGVFGSKSQIMALIQSGLASGDLSSDCENISSISAVGANDEEMERDRRGLLPVSIGGKCDIYVKSAQYPSIITETYYALLVDRTPAGDGIWRVSIARDDAPGFYTVTSIAPHGGTASTIYEVISDRRYFDLSNDDDEYEFIPDIINEYEACYSPFQTATIDFVDPDTIVTDEQIGTLQLQYDVSMLTMPGLAELQKFLTGEQVRPPGVDVLVRAAVPMFLTIEIELSADLPDETAIQVRDAVLAYVNTREIGHVLSETEVAAAIASILPTGVRVTGISLSGEIRDITGNIIEVSASDGKLSIPSLPAVGVSEKTIVLIAATDDVTIVSA